MSFIKPHKLKKSLRVRIKKLGIKQGYTDTKMQSKHHKFAGKVLYKLILRYYPKLSNLKNGI
jgi:hypothetical protein